MKLWFQNPRGPLFLLALAGLSSCAAGGSGGGAGATSGCAASSISDVSCGGSSATIVLSAPTIQIPSSSPSHTNSSSFTISGACYSGAEVVLGGGSSQTTLCTPVGTFSFLISKSVDALYTFSLLQKVGDVTSNSSNVQWSRDSAVPANPVLTAPASNPLSSGDSTITIAGGCETGAAVALSGDSTQSVTCGSGGTFSFTVTKSTDSTYNFSLTQTDLASNVSGATTLTWIRDSDIPPVPTITTPASSPIYTNGNSITISGACVDTYTVEVTGSDEQSVVCSSSSYSFTVTKSTDATYNFSVTQVNPGNGNTSSPASVQWVRDIVAPNSVTLVTPSSNPYTSNGSNITIAGACESGADVELVGSNGTQNYTCASSSYNFTVTEAADGTYNYDITQEDRAGNVSAPLTLTWIWDRQIPSTPTITSPMSNPVYSGANSLTITGACEASATLALTGSATLSTTCSGSSTYSFSVPKAVDGSYSFSIRQTDTAGNISGSVTQQWVRDSQAPAAPTILTPSSNPFTSGDSALTLSGGCEGGARVDLSGASTQTTTCSALGAYSFAVSAGVNGSYNYSLIQTDLANNASASTAFTWTRDDTIPTTPTITTPSTNPHYSNTNSLTLSGGCTSTYTVELTGSSTQSTTCTNSAYSFTVNAAIDGTYNYSVSQTNPSTLESSSAESLSWIRDTVVPAAPLLITPPTNPYTSSGDIQLKGNCELGATVNVTGSTTQSATCSTRGNFAVTVSKAIDGTYAMNITQTDRAGNASAAYVFTWVKDSSVPSSPVVQLPADNTYYSTDPTMTISGTCTPGFLVILSGDVVASDVISPAGSLSPYCPGSGEFEFVIQKNVESVFMFYLKQQNDQLVDSGAVAQQWVRDTTSPVVTLASSPASTNYRLRSQFVFTANESNVSFECSLDASVWTSCVSPVSYAELSNGSHTFEVRAADLSGNVSAEVVYTWTQAAHRTVALYHLDDSGVGTDSSSYPSGVRNPLTNSGTMSATGKFLQGRTFDGADGMSAADSSTFAAISSSFTAEAWVQFSSLPSNGAYMVIMSKNGGTNGTRGWELRIYRQGNKYRLAFAASIDGTIETLVQGPNQNSSDFTSGLRHVAVTFASGTVRIFYEGQLKTTGTVGTTGSATLFNPASVFQIGQGAGGTNRLSGVVDEVRISQTARYSTAFTPPAAAFAAD